MPALMSASCTTMKTTSSTSYRDICLSEDKRWLLTGDKGPNGAVIAWDTYTGVPIRTLYDPNPDGGFELVTLNRSGRYLATLTGGHPKILAVWDWTVENEMPLVSVELRPKHSLQNHLRFSFDSDHFLVSTGSQYVLFVEWDEKHIDYFAPELAEKGFKKPVGKFTQSMYQKGNMRALTATTAGFIVIWENDEQIKVPSADKQPFKIAPIYKTGIDVIDYMDRFVVVTDRGGRLTLFDDDLTEVCCFYLELGDVATTSLSFDFLPSRFSVKKKKTSETEEKERKKILAVAHSERELEIGDFMVATSDAVVAVATNNVKNVKVIRQEHSGAVHALSIHPFQPHLVMGSYANWLKVWNYETKTTLVSRSFRHLTGFVHTCAFDPQGIFIVIGLTTGALHVLDSLTLKQEEGQAFHMAHAPITNIVFSSDSRYMATADADYTTTLYRAFEVGKRYPRGYQYVGRHRAHYKPIRDILFGLTVDDIPKPHLVSLGADRRLVEYDLENSTKDNLVVARSERIEQSAVPCCMTWYPPFTKEHFFVTANDQYKFKLYNGVTKMCRKTTLGPTYGSPLKKLLVVPEQGSDSRRYGAFVTEDKVGLIILPLDGNPQKAMTLVAHPSGVSRLRVSHDGRYLFTAGGTDSAVHMWEINLTALEAQAKLGGEGLTPFYNMLEGGKDGSFFAQLEDFFYYALIKHQGTQTLNRRIVSTTIPLSELPFVMRAIGFYPSEQEMEDMTNEVKFSRYVETGKYVQEVDLGWVIQLYVNYRPAFGLSLDKVNWAFHVLGLPSPDGDSLSRGQLLDLLQSRGEHMTEKELADCLATLLGHSTEDPRLPPDQAASLIDRHLPAELTAPVFTRKVLGFSLEGDDEDQDLSDGDDTAAAIESGGGDDDTGGGGVGVGGGGKDTAATTTAAAAAAAPSPKPE
ncbi:cilia- and flagella-associated protein 251-like isoform X2 [Babylonia areolata]|uniref:cilia- and flagella-associated protein 251-like isoform X2 n=1 Tax=Babylonia areolata TaxID=304850 RepID=UPI003FD69C84